MNHLSQKQFTHQRQFRRNKRRQRRRQFWRIILIVFVILNVLTYAGAYGLTHFRVPGQISLGRPRPNSPNLPSSVGLSYITQRVPLNHKEWLETWLIPATNPEPKGTVLLFHGNGGSKASQLLPATQVFHRLGYNALLVDFHGVGGSSGNTTTIGAKEANDVAAAFRHAQQENLESPLILYGVSMGSAAIMNAIDQEKIQPDAVILELPFAKLVNAVKSRLRAVHFPAFPLAEMIVFWGSWQHRFNGFAHNPVHYAKSIKCPSLVMHGELDQWTTNEEIQQIFENLQGAKALTVFPNTGHTLLVTVDQERWQHSIAQFLEAL